MDVQNFAVSQSTLEEMVEWSFKYHQLIELLKCYRKTFFFFTSFTSYDFLKFEKVDPLPFVAKYYFLYKSSLKYLSIQV